MLPVVFKSFFKYLRKLSFLSALSFFGFFIFSCTLAPQKPPSVTAQKKIKKIFAEDYAILWKVTQQSIQKYPVSTSNYEKGFVFTPWIRLNSIWKDPSIKNQKPLYKIRIYLKKNLKNKTTTISIEKQIKNKKNFFSEEVNLSSNFIEEKIILYRIIQELKIYKQLNSN
ncbi:MAG: hypothetical protein HAW63_04625 [Bdellovibrionaceae bacterium]|nr:hypothetical protein [Pseudobdellovibrionaceae bacterium]